MKILRLPANTRGRDLVVGDIHGHYDDFRRLLDEAEFDPAVDRVISTGDLVDRGPDSMKCLALLKRPWFYSVAGNHELLLIEHIQGLLETGTSQVMACCSLLERMLNEHGNGASWLVRSFLLQPAAEYWNEAIELIERLPNLIVVGTGNARFHVVHADLFLGETIFDDKTIDSFERYAERGEIKPETLKELAQQISWNRGLANLASHGVPLDSMHEGLSITFCGHNIVQKPFLAMSHYHLDTGSGHQHRNGWAEHGLTMAIVENGFPVSTLTTKECA